MITAPMITTPRAASLQTFLLFLILFTCATACQQENAGPLFAFGVISDIQYWDGEPSGNRHYGRSLEKLERCVEDLKGRDLAFVVQLGDFIDRDVESIDPVLAHCRQLPMPLYHTLGNHDFSVAEEKKETVPARLGMKGRYYHFSRPGWRFIVLDGTAMSLFANPAGSAAHEAAGKALEAVKAEGRPNAMAWNSALGREQTAWLKAALAKAEGAGERVVLFCHYPVHPDDLHNLWDDREVMEILESHSCVAAYMNGHNHAGHYGLREGIHYVTFNGMVDTPDQNAYAVVEVYPDRIEIIGKGRVPSRTLKILERPSKG